MATANVSDDEDDFEMLSVKSYSTIGSLILDQGINRYQAEEKTECLFVHVSNLPAGIQEYELFEKFRQFGTIAEPGVVIKRYPDNPVDSYAFVNFNSSSVVDNILKSETPIIIRGAKLTIKVGTSKKPKIGSPQKQPLVTPQRLPDASPTSTFAMGSVPKTENVEYKTKRQTFHSRSIWVGNVPFHTTPEELAAKFTAFGKLDRPAANIFPAANRKCCYGFVNFVSPEAVVKVFSVQPNIYINDSLLEIRDSDTKHGYYEDDWTDFDKNSPPDLNLKAQKQKGPESKVYVSSKITKANLPVEEGNAVWVGNLPPDAKSRELYPLFASFGKLKVPAIMVFPSSKSATCYAFVNYFSASSAQKLLSYGVPLLFKGRRLQIRLQTTNTFSESISDSSSVSSSSKQIVAPVAQAFGTLAEPPSLQINERDHEATVPFVNRRDAEKLMNNYRGLLPMRSGTVTLILKRDYGSDSKPTESKENIRPSISQVPNVKPKPQPVPRPFKNQPISSASVHVANPLIAPITNKEDEIRQWTETTSVVKTNDENSSGIQIRNINKLTSDELLCQYVKNEKRSGGGNVQKLIIEKDCDRAVVIFERTNVAENILKKDCHLLENVKLYVSQLPPFCNSRFYVENIPSWVTYDRLKDYLEARAHCDVNKILFREDDKGAIIVFNEEKLVSFLEKEFTSKPLKDGDKQMNDVKVFSVVYPDAVLVYGDIPSVDSLTLAFEDFLTTNAAEVARPDVRNVFTKKELNMTLVIFEDHQAVSCLNEAITIADKSYAIAPFYDYLGWVPRENKANFIREHISATVKTSLTPLQFQFLSKPIADEFVRGEIKKQNWLCHFELDKNQLALMLTASTKELSDVYSKFVLGLMKSFEIRLDGPMLKSWNDKGSDLRQIVSDKDVKNYFCFNDNKTALSVLTASTEIDRIQQMVENFFSDNTVYDECIVDSQICGKYLKKYHETDLKLKCISLIVKFGSNGLITASGTKNQIELLKSDVRVMLSDCETAEYSVLRPGMSNHYRTHVGWTEINAVADQTQTIIVKDSDLDEKPLVTAIDSLLEGVLNGNVNISVVCGDLTCQNVDAIVNAANENLEHTGGLAYAIVEAGGQQIQTECRNYIKRSGCLNVSDVFVSQPGKLSCKKIIHVAGPRWNGGENTEKAKLRKSIINCINEANYARLSSIAIPAVSTKIFGYPVELAIPVIVDAVVEACKVRGIVEEIRFVDNDVNTAALFAQNVSILKDFKEKLSPISQRALVPSVSSVVPKVVQIIPLNVPFFPAPQPVVNQLTSLCFNGCTIKVVKDDIVNVAKQCNAIVNTTSANNLLGGSASCQAIMKAAGPAYVQDIQQNHAAGVQTGRLVKTIAGNLGCQNVYHIAFHAWDPAKGPLKIKTRVWTCLDQLVIDGYTNIAFPAVGTGGLKYPANIVAKTMFDAAVNWLNSHPTSNLRNIFFVVFPTDGATVLQFENEYSSRLGVPTTATVPSPSAPIGPSAVKIGSINVEIVEGDITRQKTDCIVCPSNTDLNLNHGQVANALKTAGGKEFEKIVGDYNKSSFKKGVLPVFTVNILPFKCVLFIDAPIDNHYNWHDVFMQSLKDANKLNLVSLAVPALGTGQLNRNVAEVADMMLTTIQSFATTERNTKLKCIRIVIYQKPTFDQFCRHISTMIVQGETTPSSTLFGKALDWVLKKADRDRGSRTVPVEARETEQSLRLFICGPRDSVQKAQLILDKNCDDNCPERNITKDIIGTLDNNAIDKFNELAQTYDVKLFVSRAQNKIKISGFRAIEFQNYLTDVLDKVKDEMPSDTAVKWYKRKTALWTWDLMHLGAGRLERAYHNSSKKGSVEYDLDGDVVSVDFDKMTICSKRKDVLYQLKRTESEHIPVEWAWDGKCQDEYKLVPLDAQSIEFATVSYAVAQTAAVTIQKIERVENPVKYQQYMVLKRKMEQSIPNHNAEKRLFHGTAAVNVKGICTHGFNRSLCGQNGTVYGNGCYFARDFKYSAGYGNGTVFYAKVLTGSFTLGNPNMKVAPDLDASKGTKHDSVVNDMNNPAIFVVFSDNHAYPEYLITYS